MRVLIRRDGAMGDVIHTIPVAKRLRQELGPDATLHVATGYPHLFINNPDVNEAFVPGSIHGQYDRTIDLNMSFEKVRGQIHIIDAYFLDAFGDTTGDKEYWIQHGTPPDVSGTHGWERIIGIHPSTSWACRTWPVAWWQTIVDELIGAGYSVLALGTGRDHKIERCADTRDMMGVHDQLAAIEKCASFVCTESGLMIVAGASTTPIVGVFNITRAEYVMPWRQGELGHNFYKIEVPVDCYGCAEKHQDITYMDCLHGDNRCLKTVDPKMIAHMAHIAARKGR